MRLDLKWPICAKRTSIFFREPCLTRPGVPTKVKRLILMPVKYEVAYPPLQPSPTHLALSSQKMTLAYVVKAVLLMFSGLAFITVIFPPRQAAEGKRPVYKGQLFELVVRHLARLACVSLHVLYGPSI